MRIEARPNTAGEPDAASAPDRDEPSRRACLTAILRKTGLRPTRQRLDTISKPP